jgi:metal-sulfur cluster biosynthetic enzyme
MNEQTENPKEAGVWAALKQVMDPEVGVSIVDMGLVYKVEVIGHRAMIEMTMTSPGCPLYVSIVDDVRMTVFKECQDLSGVNVEVVWDPPWDPEMMSDEAKKQFKEGGC